MLVLFACTAPPERPETSDEVATEHVPGPDEETVDDGDADAVFDVGAVHLVELRMTAAAWADVQYNPSAEAWYPATFWWDGEEVADVGVRAFGQGSVVAGKPPLKIDFDRYVDGQEWRELEQLKLDSSTQDAGFLNEAVGTAILRAMDLPAARTGWARVTVNDAPVGLFVVLESIDDGFVERWFGDDEGSLYGIGTWRYGQGLNPITWGTVADWYEPQTSVGGDGAEIVAAIEATASGTDEQFAAAVDVDAFTRIALTRAAIGAIDSFAADGNNFYLYDDGGRIRPIAWDLDADLGYPYYFENALWMGLEEPWAWSHARTNPMTGATYSDPVHARALAMGWDVAGWMEQLWAGPLDWPTLDASIAAQAAAIHDDACQDTYHTCAAFEQRVVDLRFFLHTRLSYLAGGEVAACDGATTTLQAVATVGTVTADASSWGPGFMIGGEHHCTGLFAPAPSRVTVTLDGGVLSGAVGVHDYNLQASAGVSFAIVQGGATLWESGTVSPYTRAVPFSVAVSAGTVELVASGAGSGYDAASWVGLALDAG